MCRSPKVYHFGWRRSRWRDVVPQRHARRFCRPFERDDLALGCAAHNAGDGCVDRLKTSDGQIGESLGRCVVCADEVELAAARRRANAQPRYHLRALQQCVRNRREPRMGDWHRGRDDFPCDGHSLSRRRAEVGVRALGQADEVAVVDVLHIICEFCCEAQLASEPPIGGRRAAEADEEH